MGLWARMVDVGACLMVERRHGGERVIGCPRLIGGEDYDFLN